MSLPVYPYRFAGVQQLVGHLPDDPTDVQMRIETDAGAMLMAAAVHFAPEELLARGNPVPNAASVAYALLDRARAHGACMPQENIALLVASDEFPWDAAAEREFQLAEEDCPTDPTPLWQQGEYESQRAIVSDSDFDQGRGGLRLSQRDRLARPFSTFRRLQAKFPLFAPSWSGEGDAEMRIGYQIQPSEPFSARQRFTRALALYRRAATLGGGPDALMGEGRALAALGDVPRAIAAQQHATKQAMRPLGFRATLLDYLQRAKLFAAAAREASSLTRSGEESVNVGVGFFPTVEVNFDMPPLDPRVTNDFARPLSAGADELTPATFAVGPQAGGASETVSDLSFLSRYQPMLGLGGETRWCPDWSRRLDLLLAGNPTATLSQFPESFIDTRNGETCFQRGAALQGGQNDLAGVAALELGDINGAQRWGSIDYTTKSAKLSSLEDVRQNLWRYAGNLQRAAASIDQWVTALPNDPLARLRQGEVAYLTGGWETAVLAFQAAARAAQRGGLWTRVEAQARLDEGAALEREGRHSEAVTAFAQAQTVSANWLAAFGTDAQKNGQDVIWPAYVSYNAMEQIGDVDLRLRNYRSAVEAYRAAGEYQPSLQVSPPLIQPDVLANNRAIAELQNGAPGVAADLAARAAIDDPADAIFHSTHAWALQRLRRWRAAVAEYRVAMALDGTQYPAENDLAVLLMQRHRYGEAAAVLRRAVFVRADYAKGWFNLGAALSHLGPENVWAAQGALGRAGMLDTRLAHRPPTPIFDAVPYVTNLDLSKPIPEHWTFADSQSHTPVAAAGFSVVLLVALSLARTLLPRAAPGTERWLRILATWPAKRGRLHSPGHPLIAVALTVAILLWPLRDAATGGWLPVTAFAGGILVLAAVAMRARAVIARRARLRIAQRSWPPGMIFGVAATAAGFGWAPLPVVRVDGDKGAQPADSGREDGLNPAPRDGASVKPEVANLHWVAPAALGVLAIVQLILASWLNVPLTRELGAAALVMTASLLTPVSPVDGGTIAETAGGAATMLAVAGTAVLVLVGVF